MAAASQLQEPVHSSTAPPATKEPQSASASRVLDLAGPIADAQGSIESPNGQPQDKGKQRATTSYSAGYHRYDQHTRSLSLASDELPSDIAFGSPSSDSRSRRDTWDSSQQSPTQLYQPFGSPLFDNHSRGVDIAGPSSAQMFTEYDDFRRFCIPKDSPRPEQAMSSIGTQQEFDFFGSASLASTAATSMHSMSPRQDKIGSPRSPTSRGYPSEPVQEALTGQEHMISRDMPLPSIRARATTGQFIDASPQPPELDSLSPDRPVASNSGQDSSLGLSEEQLLNDQAADANSPSYLEFPQLTRGDRIKRAMATRAAASRIVPNGIAKRFSTAAHSTSPGQTGTSSTTRGERQRSLSTSARNPYHFPLLTGRRDFARSDSAPDLSRQQQQQAVSQATTPTTTATTTSNQRRQTWDWRATSFVSGARMGPAPAVTGGSPARPRRHSALSTGSAEVNDSYTSNTGFFASLRARARPRDLNDSPLSSAAPSRPESPVESRRSRRWSTRASAPTSRTASPTRSSRGLFPRGQGEGNLRSLFKVPKEPQRAATPDFLRHKLAPDSSRLAGLTSSGSTPPLEAANSTAGQSLSVSSSTPPLRRPALLRPTAPATSTAVSHVCESTSDREPPVNYHAKLPREMQLAILVSLVELHVDEQRRRLTDNQWRGTKVRETRYTAWAAAARELVRLTRVSKTFRDLAQDGSLWQNLHYQSRMPEMSKSSFLNLVRSSGSFVRMLSLHGLSGVHDGDLLGSLLHSPYSRSIKGCPTMITNSLSLLDLSGQRDLTSPALHILLKRSVLLQRLNLSDLPAVTDETLLILGQWCPFVKHIDLSRCENLSGTGLWNWLKVRETLDPNCPPEGWLPSRLQTLIMVGIKGLNKYIIGELGARAVNLASLDLSYCKDVHDGCMTWFTAFDEEDDAKRGNDMHFEMTIRQAGTSDNKRRQRRIFPSLKRLNLSSTAVTDRGLEALAYGALPNLQVLEIANLRRVRDGGLVSLMESSPLLRRLDMEGLKDITDLVLDALTPPVRETQPRPLGGTSASSLSSRRLPFTGDNLTHLILSQCRQVTNGAILRLIQRCSALCHLELDDTNATDETAMLFTQTVQSRRVQDGSANNTLIPSYLSLIDCRGLTRNGCNNMLTNGYIRPRLGRRDYLYNHFHYGDADEALPAHPSTRTVAEETKLMLIDECNPQRTVVKSFWFWQAVDRRDRERRKAEAKLAAKNKDRSSFYTSLFDQREAAPAGSGGNVRPASIRRSVTAPAVAGEGAAGRGLAAGTLSRLTRLASGLLTPSSSEQEPTAAHQGSVDDEAGDDDDDGFGRGACVVM